MGGKAQYSKREQGNCLSYVNCGDQISQSDKRLPEKISFLSKKRQTKNIIYDVKLPFSPTFIHFHPSHPLLKHLCVLTFKKLPVIQNFEELLKNTENIQNFQNKFQADYEVQNFILKPEFRICNLKRRRKISFCAFLEKTLSDDSTLASIHKHLICLFCKTLIKGQFLFHIEGVKSCKQLKLDPLKPKKRLRKHNPSRFF